MTFKPVPCGMKNIHADWEVLKDMTAKAVDKLLYDKLDPDEFNTNATTEMDDETSPF